MIKPRILLLSGATCLFLTLPSAPLHGNVELDLDGVKGVSLDNYNRVDGLPVSYGLHGRGERFDFHARAIYRLASERFGGLARIAVGVQVQGERSIELSLQAHSITDTNDDWRIGDFENSISSVLFKEDFRNYFERQGFSVSVSGRHHRVLTGTVKYLYDRYTSLRMAADFSIFGWDKAFRSNSPVTEGWMGSLSVCEELDTRDDPEWPATGWYQSLGLEISDPWLGGDFEFYHTSLTINRYTEVTRGKNLDVRFFGSFGSEHQPLQRGVHVRGAGGLRGFQDDFIPHRGAFVSSVEGRVDLPKFFRKGPLHRERIDLLLFADVGGVHDRGPVRDMTVDSDIGAGLEGSGIFSYTGVFMAFGLGDEGRTPRVIFRIRKDLH